MPKDITERVLSIASGAYYEPHLVAPDSIGDGLATFIYREIAESVSEEDNLKDALRVAAEMMWKAVDDLRGVALALENHDGEEESEDRAPARGPDVG
jgi:hypothetical protein